MKDSIAKRISIRIIAILFVSLTILYAAFEYLSYVDELEKREKYVKAIAYIFSDISTLESKNNNEPINIEHPDITNFNAEYLCEWYDIDFTTVYIPNTENDTITYVTAAEKLEHNEKMLRSDLNGETFNYKLTEEELSVWKDKEACAFVNRKTVYGDVNSCIVKLYNNKNNALISVDVNASKFLKDFLIRSLVIFLILVLVLVCVFISVYFTIKKTVQKPVKEISEKMAKYITDGKRTTQGIENNYFAEFSTIVKSFNKMNSDIGTYVNDINNLTRERQRDETEKTIAGKIQLGFLEKDRYISDKYLIDAYIKPAKDIGGDFYDYMKIDNNKLFFAIVDVSDKGITAAITMTVLMSLFRHYALEKHSPSTIMEIANNELFAKNTELQFATAFIGILNPDTKELTYCNAAHNIPYLISKDKIKKLDESRGGLLGLFKNEKFPETTIKLNTDDIIFMYTDGITEAVNDKKEFFGENRLEDSLNKLSTSKYNRISKHVISDISDFSKNTEQHDDMTMLSIKISTHLEIDLKLLISNLVIVKESIMNLNISKKARLDLCVAAEESFVNICSYAFPNGIPENETVHYKLEHKDNKVSLTFVDHGIPFDPTKNIIDIDEYDIDNEIGGLGNFIITSNVDDINYTYENNSNILTLIKYENTGDEKNGNK